jgi:hypothetical protein
MPITIKTIPQTNKIQLKTLAILYITLDAFSISVSSFPCFCLTDWGGSSFSLLLFNPKTRKPRKGDPFRQHWTQKQFEKDNSLSAINRMDSV